MGTFGGFGDFQGPSALRSEIVRRTRTGISLDPVPICLPCPKISATTSYTRCAKYVQPVTEISGREGNCVQVLRNFTRPAAQVASQSRFCGNYVSRKAQTAQLARQRMLYDYSMQSRALPRFRALLKIAISAENHDFPILGTFCGRVYTHTCTKGSKMASVALKQRVFTTHSCLNSAQNAKTVLFRTTPSLGRVRCTTLRPFAQTSAEVCEKCGKLHSFRAPQRRLCAQTALLQLGLRRSARETPKNGVFRTFAPLWCSLSVFCALLSANFC